jgi:cytochrome c5
MYRLPILIAAPALVLAACNSTAPTAETPAPGGAPVAFAAAPEAAAGHQVYNTFCSACHDGGDETAPELSVIQTFNRDRVSTALSDGGLMALQAKMLNP